MQITNSRWYASQGFTVEYTTPGGAPVSRDKFLINQPNYMANDPNGIQDGADASAVTAGLLPRPPVGPYSPANRGVMTLSITIDATVALPNNSVLYAFGRYNSEFAKIEGSH